MMDIVKKYLEEKIKIYKNKEAIFRIKISKFTADNGIEKKKGYGFIVFFENGNVKPFSSFNLKEAYSNIKKLDEILSEYKLSDLYIANRAIEYLIKDIKEDKLTYLYFKLSYSVKDRFFVNFLRNCLPYATLSLKINEYEDGLFFVNREYKPLGIFGYKNWIDYKSVIDGKTFYYEKCFKYNYFYNDNSKPWTNRENLMLYLFKIKFFYYSYYVKREAININEFCSSMMKVVEQLQASNKQKKYFYNIIEKIYNKQIINKNDVIKIIFHDKEECK